MHYLMLETALAPSAPVVSGHKGPLFHGLPLRLRKARRTSRLSARRLADGAGVNYMTVLKIERSEPGGISTGADIVERIARVLGVSPCWLAYGIHGAEVFKQKVPGGAARPGTLPEDAAVAATAGPLACAGLPARLAVAREARKLTMKALGAAAKMTGQTIANIEDGRNVPGLDTVEALAVALDVSPCWLAYGVGQGPQE